LICIAQKSLQLRCRQLLQVLSRHRHLVGICACIGQSNVTQTTDQRTLRSYGLPVTGRQRISPEHRKNISRRKSDALRSSKLVQRERCPPNRVAIRKEVISGSLKEVALNSQPVDSFLLSLLSDQSVKTFTWSSSQGSEGRLNLSCGVSRVCEWACIGCLVIQTHTSVVAVGSAYLIPQMMCYVVTT
jgi:hypothetical protein